MLKLVYLLISCYKWITIFDGESDFSNWENEVVDITR
jgi:hypothetical protein